MIISLECSCGAKFEINDPRQVYINPGKLPDSSGRMFVAQVSADKWLDKHKACIKGEPK